MKELDDRKCKEFEMQLSKIRSKLRSVETDTNNLNEDKKSLTIILEKEKEELKNLHIECDEKCK